MLFRSVSCTYYKLLIITLTKAASTQSIKSIKTHLYSAICRKRIRGAMALFPSFISKCRISRSTQPSIPPGSVNQNLLRLVRQRQVRLIPLADETQGVQVKLCYPLTMRAIPERLRDASCGGAIKIDYLYLYFYLYWDSNFSGKMKCLLTCSTTVSCRRRFIGQRRQSACYRLARNARPSVHSGASTPPTVKTQSPPLSATPPIQLGGLGERCKLPQWVRAKPGRQAHFVAFRVKRHRF